MNPKQRAGEAAVELVQSGMIVGLGTGSTADFFLLALAQQIKSGKLTDIRGVPTSKQCHQRAVELGIPLTTLAQAVRCDITIDGADQIAPNIDAIKGLGGALLREKVVAQNSKRMVIIADRSKVVSALGDQTPLPVEVVIFEHEAHARHLQSLGCEPQLRLNADQSPFVTDNGNYIYHCVFQRIDNPGALDRAIKSRAGIVETGLFVGIATAAIVGDDSGVKRLNRA